MSFKYLRNDGDKRITSKRGARVRVEAERVDSETPCVNLTIGDKTEALTDVDADDLIKALQKALTILPTSK